MGFFIQSGYQPVTPQTPPTSLDPDPVEVLYCTILESDNADVLRGVSLDAFRVLFQIAYAGAYREASRRLLPVVTFSLDWMRNKANRVRFWQAAFALGAPDCVGWTMTSKALDLGLKSRAALSQGAVKFCQMTGLPPSDWMKAEGARKSYRDAREALLQ